MTEHAPDRIWSGIDIPKTLAGALAAVCAAVIGSFLGVAGTLVGAAVASVIASVGTEVYHRFIRHGTQKLQTIAPTFVKAPAAVGTPGVAAATDEDSPSHTEPSHTERGPSAGPTGGERRQLRWKPILIGTALVFFLAMGAILAVETFADRSLASITGNGDKGGNTLTGVVGGDEKSDTTPSPAVSETPAPADTATQPEGVTPSTPPTTPPTDGGTTPTTEAPATTDPAQTTGAGEADQGQPVAPEKAAGEGNGNAE